VFYHNMNLSIEKWIFCIEIIIWFLSFILLTWCITFVGLCVLKRLCMQDKPHFTCMDNQLKYFYISFTTALFMDLHLSSSATFAYIFYIVLFHKGLNECDKFEAFISFTVNGNVWERLKETDVNLSLNIT
jgi:hypothetical protein